eukprot:g739.t1
MCAPPEGLFLLLIVAGHLAIGIVDGACSFCQYPGPSDVRSRETWFRQFKDARNAALEKVGYAGGVFEVPELKWTQTSYIQPQMHPYDRYFYENGTYTVDRFLEDLEKRYGGVDAILMWPTYTNIGSDDRNQFDYFRSMPGGLDAVRNVTNQLKDRGVRVLWPYNPWDIGTRREPEDDAATFAELLTKTNADGFNGDTMGFVPKEFWQASEKVDHPLAFEPEGGGTDDALNWSTMGWGYFDYPHIPNVARFKFLTSGKFMTNVCNRWAKSKTDDLQTAWFNGIGYESWENVWGTWNGITQRDGEAIRRVGKMLRFFGGRNKSYCWHYNETLNMLHDPKYEPHVENVVRPDVVFASRFSNADETATLYTVVNRGQVDLLDQQQMWILPPPENASASRVYDCYHGIELKLEDPNVTNSSVDVPNGYVLFPHTNAYNGHGGTDIDHDPVQNFSARKCAARCDADPKCQCATYDPTTRECWMRAACVPEAFESTSSYEVYVKAQGYVPWSGRNAYAGHGGVEIDTDASAPEGLDPEQCQARCEADSSCGCVTFEPSVGKCWKRSSCVTSRFASSANFDVYVRMKQQPDCVVVDDDDGSCGVDPMTPPNGAKAISFDIEAGGFGCVLHLLESSTTKEPPTFVQTFLDDMRKETAGRPLSSFNSTWTYLPQKLVKTTEGNRVGVANEDMASIPATSSWPFVMTGVMIEGDDDHGVGVQYPSMPHPMREVQQNIKIDAFSIDRFPVTEADFSIFLHATKFQPTDSYNFLKNWNTCFAQIKRNHGSLEAFLDAHTIDILCLQETKISGNVAGTRKGAMENGLMTPGWDAFLCPCRSRETNKKGFNGVATLARKGLTLRADRSPLRERELDEEGRCIFTDHGTFVLFNVYVPNAGGGKRLAFKLRFLRALRQRMDEVRKKTGKPIVLAGDLNLHRRAVDVHWMGRRVDLVPFFDSSSAFVSPSSGDANSRISSPTGTKELQSAAAKIRRHAAQLRTMLCEPFRKVRSKMVKSLTRSKVEKFVVNVCPTGALRCRAEGGGGGRNRHSVKKGEEGGGARRQPPVVKTDDIFVQIGSTFESAYEAEGHFGDYTLEECYGNQPNGEEASGKKIPTKPADCLSVSQLADCMRAMGAGFTQAEKRAVAREIGMGRLTRGEREWFDAISRTMVDTFAHFHPRADGRFTCWNQYKNRRYENEGARIDYILVDDAFFRAFARRGTASLPCGEPNESSSSSSSSSASPSSSSASKIDPYSFRAAFAAATAGGHFQPASFDGGGISESQIGVRMQFRSPMTGIIYTPPTYSDHVAVSLLLDAAARPPSTSVLSADAATRKCQPWTKQASLRSYFSRKPSASLDIPNADDGTKQKRASGDADGVIVDSMCKKRMRGKDEKPKGLLRFFKKRPGA